MPERKPVSAEGFNSDVVETTAESSSTFFSWESLESSFSFIASFWWLLLLIIILVGGIFLLASYFKKRHKQIQKLWLFTLFFLQKRQMLIPLVITLSRKDGMLDSATQLKLIEIRDKCREVSFKKHPTERLKLEETVSEILYRYFSTLAKNNQIVSDGKFAKVVKDLEFIDAKLVELQQTYNSESSRWNNLVDLPVIKYFFKTFRLTRFESF